MALNLKDEGRERLGNLTMQVADKLRRQKPERESANVCKRLENLAEVYLKYE